MFERHRERRAQAHYDEALAAWQHERDEQAAALSLAQTFHGQAGDGLLLKPGEAEFARITDVGLVEERRGAGSWQGHSSGVSIPVGSLGGRSVRYRVGATAATTCRARRTPRRSAPARCSSRTSGSSSRGSARPASAAFAKLLGYESSDDGSTTFSVSNRQKPVTIHYGSKLNGWVRLRLDLAVAQARDQVPALVERLQQGLAAIDAARPTPPPGSPPARDRRRARPVSGAAPRRRGARRARSGRGPPGAARRPWDAVSHTARRPTPEFR